MTQDPIEYTSTDITGVEHIRPLWEMLNFHHHARARAFRNVYSSWTFDDRKDYFLHLAAAGPFRIDLASDPATGRYVGYCVSSISPEGAGEIESVFVIPAFRSLGTGTVLMENALAWLSAQNPVRIRVSVADGNEEVFLFYEKFGFFPRMTVLEQKRE